MRACRTTDVPDALSCVTAYRSAAAQNEPPAPLEPDDFAYAIELKPQKAAEQRAAA